MEWQDFIIQFEQSLKKKRRSISTCIAYVKDIKQLALYFESKKLFNPKSISYLDLKAYIEFITEQGQFSPKTISRKINSLRTFFKFLLSIDCITNNPCLIIKHPLVETSVPRTLTISEYRAVRDCARTNRKIYTMIELLLQTGIRIGELSRLKRHDFYKDKEGKYFLHIMSFSTIPTREVELNPVIAICLHDYLKLVHNIENNMRKYMFFTKTGRLVLIRNIRTAINRIFHKAGVTNATINDLRNTFIIFQLENGMRIEKVAELVGHKKTTTTQRYMQYVTNSNKKSTLKITPL